MFLLEELIFFTGFMQYEIMTMKFVSLNAIDYERISSNFLISKYLIQMGLLCACPKCP